MKTLALLVTSGMLLAAQNKPCIVSSPEKGKPCVIPFPPDPPKPAPPKAAAPKQPAPKQPAKKDGK